MRPSAEQHVSGPIGDRRIEQLPRRQGVPAAISLDQPRPTTHSREPDSRPPTRVIRACDFFHAPGTDQIDPSSVSAPSVNCTSASLKPGRTAGAVASIDGRLRPAQALNFAVAADAKDLVTANRDRLRHLAEPPAV